MAVGHRYARIVATHDNTGRTIDQAEDALLDAMRASDVVALEHLIADDLRFTGPDGVALSKEDDLRAHATGATRFERISETRRHSVESDGVGTTETTAFVSLRHGDGHAEVDLVWRREWRITDGRWQVVAGEVRVLS